MHFSVWPKAVGRSFVLLSRVSRMFTFGNERGSSTARGGVRHKSPLYCFELINRFKAGESSNWIYTHLYSFTLCVLLLEIELFSIVNL